MEQGMRSQVMVKNIVILSAVMLLSAPVALANEFTLSPGQWQITEGLDVGSGGLPSNVRSICIAKNETHVDSTWFAKLAKPSENCNARLSSHSGTELTFQMSCPNKSGEISGPSHVAISGSSFTIQSDLSMNLGGYPLPMNRALSARKVGTCQ